jgi:hypothetical protein
VWRGLRKADVRASVIGVDDDLDEAIFWRELARAESGMKNSGGPPASPDPLAAFPACLRHSTEHAQRLYRRAEDLFALPATVSATARPERSLVTDSGGRLDIFRGASSTAPPGSQAVYLEPASGKWMVPSGRVFVRFAQTVNAESRRAVLLQAGYRIVAIPAYAPQAAWLEALDENAAHSLGGIARLEALSDVENVEPQWLGARQAKSEVEKT